MSDLWGIGNMNRRYLAEPEQQTANARLYTTSPQTTESMRPPIARRGVVMLTIGCQTVLAWVESPVQRIDAGPVGIHLQSGLGDALLSIDEMRELHDALSGLIEEAKLKEHEIRSKLAGEDLP